MRTDTIKTSFSGGEISPDLLGRIDLDKYQNGLALCSNMVVTPQGPVTSRANFRHVARAGSNQSVVTVPFVFSIDDWCVLEFGDHYMRVHVDGGQVLRPESSMLGMTFVGADLVVSVSNAAEAIREGAAIYLRNSARPDLNNRRLYAGSNSGCPVGYRRLLDERGAVVPWVSLAGDGAVGHWQAGYEIETPYSAADVTSLRSTQKNDVLTLLHPSHPVRTLARHSMIDWRLALETFAPRIASVIGKTTCEQVGSSADNKSAYAYVVTAVSSDGREESLQCLPNSDAPVMITGANNWNSNYIAFHTNTAGLAVNDAVLVSGLSDASSALAATGGPNYSRLNNTICTISHIFPSGTGLGQTAPAVILRDSAGAIVTGITNIAQVIGPSSSIAKIGIGCNLATAGARITVTWLPRDGVNLYNVYRSQGGGLFGYVGKSQTPLFVDRNIIADMSRTPPMDLPFFAEPMDYPSASCYYQQRKFFASTKNRPQSLWATKPGTEANLLASFPLRADDALSMAVEAIGNARVQHILPLRDLLVLTDTCEAVVNGGGNEGAITATTASITVQSYVGASPVTPAMLGSSALFVDRSGRSLIEMAWRGNESSYAANNISVMASHLLASGVTSLAAAPGHLPMLLMASSDGRLVGLTYMPEHKVLAFHQHSIASGALRHVCSVPAADGVKVFAVIDRDGQQHIEMAEWSAPVAVCLDGAFHYMGAPTQIITGLREYPPGTVLDVVADGVPHQSVTVDADGAVTLGAEYTDVWLGFAYAGELRTLPQVVQQDSAGAGLRMKKNPVSALLRIRGDGVLMGQQDEALHNYVLRTDGALGEAHNTVTSVECPLSGGWDNDMTLIIQQATALPLTVYSLAVDYAVSG